MSEKKLYLVAYHDTTVRNKPDVLSGGMVVDRKFEYVSDHADCYKIGVAEEPESRLSSMQSGTPNELRLVTTIESDDASSVESDLHSLYSHRHMRGEWFNILPNDVNSLKGLDRIDPDNMTELLKMHRQYELDRDKGLYVQIHELRGGDE